MTKQTSTNQSGTSREMTKSLSSRSDKELAIGLARVSSRKQAEDGVSLDVQASTVKRIADERDLRLVGGVIREEGKSGQSLDRDGIDRVIDRAEDHDVKYLIVCNLSCIGRTALETVYFLLRLRLEYGVSILTPEGVADVQETETLLIQVVKALSAENEVSNKSKAARASKVSNFRNGSWGTAFRNVPPGYEWDEDEEWIQIKPEEARKVREAYQYVLQTSSSGKRVEYSEIANLYGDELGGLNTQQVKKLLSRPVYIGEPTFGGPEPYLPRENSENLVENVEKAVKGTDLGSSEGVVKSDPSLQIVSEDKFHEVRSVVRVKEARRRGNDDATDNLESLLERYGILPVTDASEWVKVVCKDCSADMMKNGLVPSATKTVHQWICPDCSKTVTFPKNSDLEAIEGHDRAQKEEETE